MRDHDSTFVAHTDAGRTAGPETAPGRRTLTMSLPAHPGASRAAAEGTAAAAPDPASAAHQRALLDAAIRPDLHDAPGALPGEVRGRMEQAFGADFGGVRVHQDGAAEGIGARAFARGTDLHFAPGAYQPGTAAGDELIGHELAHLVQQAEGRVAPTIQAKGVTLATSQALEHEADALGARAAAGEVVRSGPLVRPGAGAVAQGYFDDAEQDAIDEVARLLGQLTTGELLATFGKQRIALEPYQLAPWRALVEQMRMLMPQAPVLGGDADEQKRQHLMPLERSMRLEQRDGWNIGVFPQGTSIFKGMDPSADRIMRNDDINNSFAHTPGWFGDADVARSYAIRSTVKDQQKKQQPVNGQLDDYDPTVACIAEFEAQKDVRLFSLLDKPNIDKLLEKIEDKIDRQLGTPIGDVLAEDRFARYWALGKTVDTGKPKYDRLGLLRKAEVKKKVYDIMRSMIGVGRRRGILRGGDGIDATAPLGLTTSQMRYRFDQGMQKDGADEARVLERVRKLNIKEAGKVIDELARLAGQRFSIQLGTGIGMGWAGQKQVMGQRRVDQRRDNRKAYPGPDTRDSFGASTPIGPNPDQFNRISLMGNDLRMLQTITEHVNVDGFWGKAVPTKWHRDAHFHPEMAVKDPGGSFQYTGHGVDPDDARELADDQHEEHVQRTERWKAEHAAEKLDALFDQMEQVGGEDDEQGGEDGGDDGDVELDEGGF